MDRIVGVRGRLNAGTRKVPSSEARHRLPSRRSVTGAVMIVAAASGVLIAHRSATATPSERYVVLAAAVPAGHRLRAADLGTIALDLPDGVPAVAEQDASDLLGRVTRGALDELDLLRPADVHEPGRFTEPGSLEVAIELDLARALSGTLAVGDVVDVLATDREATGTRTVAAGVRVSAVDSAEDRGIGASGTVQVRLALPDADAAAEVVDASIRSEVSLALPAPTPEDDR